GHSHSYGHRRSITTLYGSTRIPCLPSKQRTRRWRYRGSRRRPGQRRRLWIRSYLPSGRSDQVAAWRLGGLANEIPANPGNIALSLPLSVLTAISLATLYSTRLTFQLGRPRWVHERGSRGARGARGVEGARGVTLTSKRPSCSRPWKTTKQKHQQPASQMKSR
ncbi:hypothetical protein GE21DRAFT_1348924, partial [Neurospora crassa]